MNAIENNNDDDRTPVVLGYQRPSTGDAGNISVRDDGRELTITIPPTGLWGSVAFHACVVAVLGSFTFNRVHRLVVDVLFYGPLTGDLVVTGLALLVAGYLAWLSLARVIRFARTGTRSVVATISPAGVSVTNPQDWAPPTRELRSGEIFRIDVSHFRTLSGQIEYRIWFEPPLRHRPRGMIAVDFTFVTNQEVGEAIVRRIREIVGR